ncbi:MULTISPECIES: ABC transporter permease [unclassified Sedimentibacter]|uniref:ABC transporter permease n=1 Tax=unclassified Sedimentibacter TaxID=2649220 RepID=UPI0027DECC74|nr:ABC transporter permease [Sedimentibacter sp. MB35-C1]WMJ78966.1 ABC transporter permease [Sedimentibacter sp. MB35-C1]
MNSGGNCGKLFISFKQYLIQITKDAMLFIVCLSPFLCGVLFKFGIPSVAMLKPYYLLFDLLLAVLTPMMISYVSAMVILGDVDEGITRHMAVTPLGKSGYLISKLGFPLAASFFITIIVMIIFSLTEPALGRVIGISILTSMLGLIMSMMVISIAANKVEGMAVMKLSGIIILGIPAAFLIAEKFQYLFFFLPSLWIAKFFMENSLLYFFLCIGVSTIWILLFIKRFIKKIY